MKTVHRLFFVAALAAALPLFAQTSSAGSISGHVTDAVTKLSLAGAHVTVPGTALETYTDATGNYALTSVPAGVRTIEFSYVGYPDATYSIDVASARTVRLDAAFGDAVRMDKFVIEGSLVGTARAINQQRSADTLTNIVASDAIGQFPDQNAAESLQRIPGLALYRDQGEGRYIIIRGINAQYNHVAVDGASLATPESGLRTAPLDVIGSDSLGAIEVTKVNTPDMDADGLGGSVNLRSRSAFDSQERQVMFNAETLYGNLRENFGSKFNGTYADIFADGKLGVLVSASFQRRPYGSSNFEESGGWSPFKSPTDGLTHYAFNGGAFREYQILRTRKSANASLEYRLTPETTVYLRTSYSDFTDKENRWVTTIPFTKGSTITALTDTSGSFTGVTAVSKNLRTREKEQALTTAVLGFDSKGRGVVLDGQLSASLGQEWKPEELEGVFTTKAASSWSYAFDNPYHIVATSSGGAGDPANPASYVTQKSTYKNGRGKESELGGRFNARYALEHVAYPTFVKVGGSYRAKEKFLDKDSASLSAVPATFTFAALSDDGSTSLYPYFRGPRWNVAALRSAFFDNKSAFTITPKESILSDFTSHEDVGAAYAMGTTTIDRLNVIGGVRAENTDFDTKGSQLRAGVYSPMKASTSYTNWEPGLALRYDATKQIVLRASWSNTLSRPTFTESAISRNVNDDKAAPSVSQGNSKLKPLESANWDASVEYYLPSLGVASAAVFYKDLKNFTYSALAGTDVDTSYPLTTFVNGPKGHIAGLELAYQQQLRFLPAPFNGLGFAVNATFTDSEASFPTRPGEKLAFIGQSKTIGNVALTYQKGGFSARLAANYRTPRLREDEALGATAADDRFVDRFFQLDFSTGYKFAQRWEVYGEVINLTNEPFRVYFGNSSPKRLVQFEEYDVSANFGVRWKL